MLYDKVEEKIYPNQLQNFRGASSIKLHVYEEKLKKFKYNKIRKELIRVFKGYNYYISEPISHILR